MKITCLGTSNIGKSTYIKDFLSRWTMYKTPEKTYRDIIKEKGLRLNEDGDEESQKIILDALVDQAIAYSKEDNVIFDRGVLDNLAYTAWLHAADRVSDKFLEQTRQIVHETLKLYDVVFFFPISKFNDVKLVEKENRSNDPVFREEIDILLKMFQKSYLQGDGRVFPLNECPAFIELYGNPVERIQLTSLYIKDDGTPYGDDQSLVNDIYMPPEKQIYVPR